MPAKNNDRVFAMEFCMIAKLRIKSQILWVPIDQAMLANQITQGNKGQKKHKSTSVRL